MTTTTAVMPIVVPFTVLIDDREGAPYAFTGLHADASDDRGPLYVPKRFARLKTGDYTIEGLEDLVAIERKSLEDLFGTLGQRREQFEAEHQRMAEILAAGGEVVVVIESDWRTILLEPPEDSRLNPKTVHRTWLHWRRRYGVEWITASDRQLAQVTTFRILERFWKEHEHREIRDVSAIAEGG